jgi:hypothetical protein
LFDLVRLRQRVLRLEIQNFDDTLAREDVVASSDSLREAKPQKESTKLAEPDVPIGRSSEHP